MSDDTKFLYAMCIPVFMLGVSVGMMIVYMFIVLTGRG